MDNLDFKCIAGLRNGSYGIRDRIIDSTSEIGDGHKEKKTLSLTTKIWVTGLSEKKYKPVLILAIDVSGSMSTDGKLEKVKRSLIYLYSRLKSKCTSSGVIADIMDLHLITFATEAKLVWSTAFCLDDTFVETVSDLKTECSTNIYDALTLAKQLMLRKSPTWLVLLTDGCSTVGPNEKTNPYVYSNLFKSFPCYVDTIAVTIGDDYSESIVACVKDVMYVNTFDRLQEAFAHIYLDMFNLVGYGAKLVFPSWVSSRAKVLMGGNEIGFLPRGRLIRSIILPLDSRSSEEYRDVTKLESDPVFLDYIDVTGQSQTIRIPVHCYNEDLAKDDISAYYDYMATQYIKDLATRNNYASLVSSIDHETSLWRKGLSDKHRQQIRAATTHRLRGSLNKIEAICSAKSRSSHRGFGPEYIDRCKEYI